MKINLGIEPERVAAYKKQYSILFLAARAERPKRGQSVCKAQSAAADGDSHRKLQKTAFCHSEKKLNFGKDSSLSLFVQNDICLYQHLNLKLFSIIISCFL